MTAIIHKTMHTYSYYFSVPYTIKMSEETYSCDMSHAACEIAINLVDASSLTPTSNDTLHTMSCESCYLLRKQRNL